MSRITWNANDGRLDFQTELLQGTLRADGTRHGIVELIHRPTGARIDRDFVLALYRLLCRSGWMGEAREMSHTVRPTDAGLELTWAPRPAHAVQLSARFAILEPNAIDCTIGVVGHAFYPDYEVFLSNYFAKGLRSGGYLQPTGRDSAIEPEQIQPVANGLFREMYISFPRDERAANLITDGRWQRGRHFTRFLPARYYGLPIGFYSQGSGPVDVLVMGRPDDTFAVSMAYATDDPQDAVGQHNSLYLSLFGKDLHPGERWETTVRLVVDDSNRDASRHRAAYADFLAAHGKSAATLDVGPFAQLRGL